MSTLSVSPEQIVHAAQVATAMKAGGLPDVFIAAAMGLAHQNRGAYELMALWEEAESPEDRDEMIVGLQELIDDEENAPPRPVKKPYIRFDQLDDVAARVVAFKHKLRGIIDRHGGVSQVAQLCGIPQPSLSRMLHSPSMPRRSTLYKIADALNLPETEIATDFTW